MSLERVRLVRVSSPKSDAELVTLVEALESYGIPCFVGDSGVGSPVVHGRARRSRFIMVSQERLSVALELIGIVQRSGPPKPENAPCDRWSATLRAFTRLVRRYWSRVLAQRRSGDGPL